MMTRSSNFQIFPKRNFVKLSFLKFFEIFSLSSKHASVKRFLSLTLKITLIEKYLPITMLKFSEKKIEVGPTEGHVIDPAQNFGQKNLIPWRNILAN